MSWEREIRIQPHILGTQYEFDETFYIQHALWDGYNALGLSAQEILAFQYPFLEHDLQEFYSGINESDITRMQSYASHLFGSNTHEDITLIPQRLGAKHWIKQAVMEKPNLYIVQNDPDSKRKSSTPKTRYIAPFSMYCEQKITVTKFDPDSQVVRKIYPISGTVQMIVDPHISMNTHPRWERPEFIAGFTGDRAIVWDEESNVKLKSLNLKILESVWSHRQAQANQIFHAIQSGGMSGKG